MRFARLARLSLALAAASGLAACAQQSPPGSHISTAAPTPIPVTENAPTFTPSSVPTAQGTQSRPSSTVTDLAVEPTARPGSLYTPETRAALAGVLDDGADWYILVTEACEEQPIFQRSSTESVTPASTIKIPVAMAVLKILEDQGRTMEDLESYGINGRNFSNLLEAMVVRSEENATDSLEFFARGDNRLRHILDAWGLTDITFDPRRATAKDLAASLQGLYDGSMLQGESRDYLLGLMRAETSMDAEHLGVMTAVLPGSVFYNKRGSMLSPTIVADSGILVYEERAYIIVIIGTPAENAEANFTTIKASLESFGLELAEQIRAAGAAD